FMKLLDNYERSTGITERVTPEELTEINLFLDAVLETQVMKFSWHGVMKPVGSAFIGTSPEFEMALFTIIFLMNRERSTTVLVNIDQCQMELVVIRQGRCLGTAYPKLLSSNSRHVGVNSH
ncbi:hypothetical protein XENOCAPTIV_008876, partial [Xenoophorus captivus]